MKKKFFVEKIKAHTLFCQLLILLVSIILSFTFGYFSGIFKTKKSLYNSFLTQLNSNQKLNVENQIFLFNEINAANIEKHLKYLTSIPHLAGTPGDKISADYVADQWKIQGLDSVQLNDYDILLDFTDDTKFNNIQIFDSNGTIEKLYEIKETIYDSELDFDKISKPFLAYSQNGSYETDKVFYVNYCLPEDFEVYLKYGINIENTIVLCRYGVIFRGNKIKNAQLYGAKAVLLYDDPPTEATTNDRVYPNGIFLPENGTQRGTVFLKEGDPQTPIYPSIDSAYRINEKDQPGLPKILAQCIGYGLAAEIFDLFKNDNNSISIPKDWYGYMKNVSYTFGGALKMNRKFTLNVYNSKKISKIFNVVGTIKGSFEPDRYVMVGSHRDAWTFGSVDPSSAQSVLLEVSRSLVELKKAKLWQPKRSIVFLSWSGEEYGLMGSTEWIEEFEKKLISNAVVYINLDMAAYGNYSYQANASPLLHELIYAITKSIKMNEDETVYDRWFKNDPNSDKTQPRIKSNMGAGSDHVSFLQRVGVPCIDQKFVSNNNNKLLKIGTFPLYHTSYETFKLYSKFIDPGFQASKIMGMIIADLARNISSSAIVPFNCGTYARELSNELKKFKLEHNSKLILLNITLDGLENSIGNFTQVVKNMQKRIDSADNLEYNLIRQYNEQLRNLERAFLDYASLNRNSYLHTIYAPSFFNKYSSYSFPTLVDAINQYENSKGNTTLIENIKYKLSIVIYRIQSASSILKEPSDFTRYV